MKSGLYPDILFHFTKHKTTLFKMLKSGYFKLSYSKEKILAKGTSKEFYAPMVSFCDLRFSELETHMKSYGGYGIALSKEWANKNGLNPVFYISQHSHFGENFIGAISSLFSHLENDIHDGDQHTKVLKTYMNMLDTYRYIKNYEADLYRKGKKIENYRFANEREWRYVPPISLDIDYPFAPPHMNKKILNEKISSQQLSFSIEDIKYIIVRKDDYISDVINFFDSQFKKGLIDEDSRNKLYTKILTVEQIHSDM